MKLEAGLERLKECYLFAHLTYCILSATFLLEWLKTTQAHLVDGYLHYIFILCTLVILGLVPAQHKIITKTLYRDTRNLHIFKVLYTAAICVIYIPMNTGMLAQIDTGILVLIPVILNSIICGTAYGIVTALLTTLAGMLPGSAHPELLTDFFSEHILTLALMITTAWFIGQSFNYILHLFYQLAENEKNLNGLLDNLGIATLHVDASGQIVGENKSFQELVRADIEANSSMAEVMHRHFPFLAERWPGANQSQELNGIPIFGRALDGQGRSVPVQCLAYPVSSAPGEDSGIILCIRDISLSEKLAEEKLRTSYFIDFLNAGVLLADGAGHIIEMNRQAESLLNLDRDRLLNSNLIDLLRRLTKQEAAGAAGNNSSFEVESAGRTLLVNCANLLNNQGETIGQACIINDITNKKEMERKLQRSATLSAIGEMAAGMAHEIRNPLTSIKGFLQLMREKKEARVGNFSAYFDIILSEVDRINGITSEFLKLAKPEKVSLHSIDLNKSIDSIWELLQNKALMHEVELVKEIDAGPLFIMGNVDLLKQAIINLVNNAIQATGPGRKVKVMAKPKENGGVLLAVEDNGAGMDEKVLSRIFDPFFTTRDEGTGLGLAITSKIVNDHNGSITVDSTPGKGTTFYIGFPAVE
ncbi:ATP-binding protein [Desulfoscipio geothermicus]|uniref:histidine kinase n=1 Tax=Desulfoscipio geothermicus DSM 3669 TaxID=1121426 RepID=A0A1I6CYT3_9FIRM|nr:ATP-binding protein [Desulfoscipio geothermicus]SFQ98213.1 PAS domain S-box-containing protein [Desulfoscipio geothermicus DSM 3669]